MKVLVVGGAGYVGSVLVEHLWNAGHDVTVLDLLLFGSESLDSLKGKPRFRLVRGDLRDEAMLEKTIPGQDAVCLLAAIVGEPACNRDPKTAEETNYHGAVGVLNAARKHGVQRFVFTSTCSNYGAADSTTAVDESAPLQPLSVYSESKVAAEKAILQSASDDFCPTVLRLSTAFGLSPRMRFDLLVSDFTRAAYRDGKIVIYGGDFWRPFVHTQDIAAAIEHVLGSAWEKVCGEVFNIGRDDNNVRKCDLGKLIQDEIDGTTLEFIGQGTDPRSYRVDFAKMRDQLEFTPSWTIADGVRELHSGLREGSWSDVHNPLYSN